MPRTPIAGQLHAHRRLSQCATRAVAGRCGAAVPVCIRRRAGIARAVALVVGGAVLRGGRRALRGRQQRGQRGTLLRAGQRVLVRLRGNVRRKLLHLVPATLILPDAFSTLPLLGGAQP